MLGKMSQDPALSSGEEIFHVFIAQQHIGHNGAPYGQCLLIAKAVKTVKNGIAVFGVLGSRDAQQVAVVDHHAGYAV